MESEALKRIQGKFDQVFDCLYAAGGDYVEGSAIVGQALRRNESFITNAMRSTMQSLTRSTEKTSLAMEWASKNAEAVDTREKMHAELARLPDDRIPDIDETLDRVLKELLPSMGVALRTTAKVFPKPTGGRPSKIPSEAECRLICDEIRQAENRGVPRTKAQTDAGKSRGMSKRLIDEIWSRRTRIRRSAD